MRALMMEPIASYLMKTDTDETRSGIVIKLHNIVSAA